MPDLLPIMYGVWLPGIGWLRGAESRAVMFTEKVIALETARRIGSGAEVYFIDQSLVDIESQLLDAESRKGVPFFARIHRVLKATPDKDR